MYVLDWHDADICGKEVLNKETGRIFRITAKDSKAQNWDGRYSDLATLDDAQLVKLQLSESAWHARRARLILQHRAEQGMIKPETHAELRDIFELEREADYRLRGLWALHVTGGTSDAELLNSLSDPDEHIRAWSVQLLCEDYDPPSEAVERFATMAREDDSAVVRLYLAAAMQRLNHDQRWPIADALISHAKDIDDHNIPKMIWFAVEPMVIENPDRAIELAVRSQIPVITRHIARRLGNADELEVVVAAVGTQAHAQQLLLLGLRDALDGRFDVQPPSNWQDVQGALTRNSDSARIATELSQHFGNAQAVKQMLETVQDAQAQLGRSPTRTLELGRPATPGTGNDFAGDDG